MVLMSADGKSAAQIADLLGYYAGTVRRRLDRFTEVGIADLCDRPRSGRPPRGGPQLTARIGALLCTVICDNDGIHHAYKVHRWLQAHPRIRLLYGAAYSPTTTRRTDPGRAQDPDRQYRRHLHRPHPPSPHVIPQQNADQMLTTAAPWTSPWIPSYAQKFRSTA
jgi:hypothetical protein